jgi:hypothetical protein
MIRVTNVDGVGYKQAFTWGRGTSIVFAVKVEVSISTCHVIRKG